MMTLTIETFGAWLLAASLKGSLLIGIVALIHWLAKDRIPAAWRYAMWILVLARLVLPIAPESRLSIFNLTQNDSNLPVTAMASGDTLMFSSDPLHEPGFRTVSPVPASPFEQRGYLAPLLMLWLLGVAVFAFPLTVRALRAHGRLHLGGGTVASDPQLSSLLSQCKEALGVEGRVQVVESSLIRTPALHGVFRPLLLLPPGMLHSFSRNELRHILLHELAHLRRRDVLVNWLMSLIQTLHWFNPLVWLALGRMKQERELACDELALSTLPSEERNSYGHTILKLLDLYRPPAPLPALVGILDHKHEIKRRMTMIATFRNHSKSSFLFLALVAVLGVVSLTDATAGEKHKVIAVEGAHVKPMFKDLSPAEKAALDRVGQKVSMKVATISFTELVTSVSAKTGVSITFPSDLAAEADKSTVSVSADNVPGDILLMEALMAVDLAIFPDGDGMKIVKFEGQHKFHHKGDGPHEVMIKKRVGSGEGQPGEKRIFVHEGEIEKTLSEDGKKMIRRKVMIQPDGTVKELPADATMIEGNEIEIHNEVTAEPGQGKVVRKNLLFKESASGPQSGKLFLEVRQPAAD